MYKIHIFILTAIIIAVSTLTGQNKEKLSEKERQALVDSAELFHMMSVEYRKEGDFKNSEEYLNRSLAIKLIIYEKNSAEFASTYNNLGVINKTFGNYTKALIYYSRAEKIFLNNYGNKYIYIANIYGNKANIYKSNGELEKALLFQKKSLAILETNKAHYPRHLALVYNNSGNTYRYLSMHDIANKYYEKSIELKKKYNLKFLPRTYSNMAKNYMYANNYNEAATYFQLALTTAKQKYKKNSPYFAHIYSSYGMFCKEQGETNKALTFYNKAYNIYTNNYGPNHSYTSWILTKIGNIYRDEGNLQKAFEYYQQSLIALSKTFNDTSKYTNPEPDDDLSKIYYLLEIFKQKAKAFYLYYKNTQNLKDLKASHSITNKCIELVEKLRNSFQSQESRFVLSEAQDETFHQAIDIAIELYNTTRNSNYLNFAFIYTEKGKAANLLTSLKEASARKKGGIPDSLQEKQNNIDRQILACKQLVYEAKKENENDTTKIQYLESLIFNLSREKDSLLKFLETNYPNWYKIRYDTRVISIPEVQEKLNNNQVFIEYAFTDSLLAAIIITPDTCRLYTTTADSMLQENIQIYSHCLKDYSKEKNRNEQYSQYTQAAHYLWRKLIAPLKIHTGKSLIISPYGELAYIPFEALLCSLPKKGNYQYYNLDYLLYHHPVSYAYSSTLFFEPYTGKSEKLLGGFAPGYENRDSIMPLDNIKEMKKIKNIFSGNTYTGEAATKEAFLKNAGKYSILVLNMHGFMDTENEMNSSLAFSNDNLHAWEIYSMNLNAKLVVSNACNTGNGRLCKGEGIMSVARAFAYAGCPCTVMPLWAYKNHMGNMCTRFLKLYKKGLSLDKALQQAKIEHIKAGFHTHPHYWAGLVLNGNPVNTRTSNNYHYLLLFIPIILLIGIYITCKHCCPVKFLKQKIMSCLWHLIFIMYLISTIISYL